MSWYGDGIRDNRIASWSTNEKIKYICLFNSTPAFGCTLKQLDLFTTEEVTQLNADGLISDKMLHSYVMIREREVVK